MAEKLCATCHKPHEEATKTCKACKEYQRRYAAKNREKIRAYQKRYVAANRDKVRAYHKQWQAANHDKSRAAVKKWRDAHPDKVKEYYEKTTEQRKKYYRAYRKRNRDRILDNERKYRVENADRIKKYKDQWRLDNAESLREASHRNYRNNKEWYAQYNKKWKNEHPDRIRELWRIGEHKRRARIWGNGGGYTPEQWRALFDEQDGCCFYCGELLYSSFDKEIHTEHKLPVSRGGSSDISNIALACSRCNMEKGTKTEEEYMEWKKLTTTMPLYDTNVRSANCASRMSLSLKD